MQSLSIIFRKKYNFFDIYKFFDWTAYNNTIDIL